MTDMMTMTDMMAMTGMMPTMDTMTMTGMMPTMDTMTMTGMMTMVTMIATMKNISAYLCCSLTTQPQHMKWTSMTTDLTMPLVGMQAQKLFMKTT